MCTPGVVSGVHGVWLQATVKAHFPPHPWLGYAISYGHVGELRVQGASVNMVGEAHGAASHPSTAEEYNEHNTLTF